MIKSHKDDKFRLLYLISSYKLEVNIKYKINLIPFPFFYKEINISLKYF